MNIVGKSLETTKKRLDEIASEDVLTGEERLYLSESEEGLPESVEILSEPTGEDSKRTFLELESSIVMWSLIFQATIVWLVPDKKTFSVGLWLGCFISLALAYHMWISIDKALNMDEKNARAYMTSRSIIRYASIVIMLGVSMAFLSKWAHPLAVFLGVMTLKCGAYTQPVVHNFVNRKTKNN